MSSVACLVNLPRDHLTSFEQIKKLPSRSPCEEEFKGVEPNLNPPKRRQALPNPRNDDGRAIIRGDILELCVLRKKDQIFRLEPVADQGIRQTSLAQGNEMLGVVACLL